MEKAHGKEGVRTLLAVSINAVQRDGVIHKSRARQMILWSSWPKKAIAHLTESRLLDKSRNQVAKALGQWTAVAPALHPCGTAAGRADRVPCAGRAVHAHGRGHATHPRLPRAPRGTAPTQHLRLACRGHFDQERHHRIVRDQPLAVRAERHRHEDAVGHRQSNKLAQQLLRSDAGKPFLGRVVIRACGQVLKLAERVIDHGADGSQRELRRHEVIELLDAEQALDESVGSPMPQ